MLSKPMAQRILVVLALIVVLTGCSSPTPTAAPTVPPQPTVNVQATVSAAQTQAVQAFVANLTQNAPTATRVQPTNTLAPSATPLPTNTPLPVVKTTATATQRPQPVGPTATIPIYCTARQDGPSDPLDPGASFTARWVVKNTGSETWTKAAYDVMYSSGARFDQQAGQDLAFDVARGEDITIGVNMIAPSKAGTYRANWVIIKGFQIVCVMPLQVVVK